MSIQSLLSSTIKKILSEYVSFPGQAEIARSGWQAEMTFHEVKVNPSVFDKFSLPFELKHSSIDRIKLRIHWTNLFTQPTEIFVDKINMVVVPREHEISPEIQASVAENLELKQKKLDAWEELHFSSKEHRETMLSTILNNINIRINELHFCIQVPQGNGKSANLGIIIEDLVISTTDENFQISEKIDKSNTQMLWKLISIKNLLLYTKECNTGEDVCFTPIMEDEYVLRPLSASLFLTINNVERKFDSMIDPLQCDPKFKALLKIDDCLLQISKAQYDSLLDIFVSISNAQVTSLFRFL